MTELRVGDRVILFDQELTRRTYSAIERGGADICTCSYCRNYAAQRMVAYPEAFLGLLEQLGIDPTKEDEVYETHFENGLTHYGGWFFLSGKLRIVGEHLWKDTQSHFQFHFTDAKQRPSPPKDFGDHVIAIDFLTKIPWIIEGEP